MSVSSIAGLSQLLGGFGSSTLLNTLGGTGSSSSSSSGSTGASGSSSSSSSGSSSAAGGSSTLTTLAQFDLQSLQGVTQQVNGYSQLKSTLGAFQNSMFSVLTLPFQSALSGITSSNGSVAFLSPTSAVTYAVNVNQLAQGQTVTTSGTAYTDPTTTVFASGSTLSFNFGNVDGADGTFQSTGTPQKVTISDGSLDGVVKSINGAGLGVVASVTGDANTGYQLKFTGQNSGVDAGFQVTAVDPSGGTGGLASVSALNYNAAAVKAGTSGFATGQAAQDAKYTVNGQSFASPTNLGVPVANGININLVATGSTIISQPQAPTTTINAADSLASTVNALIQTFGQLTGSGGPLAGQSFITQEIQNDVQLAVTGFYNNGSTVNNLTNAGFAQQADGSYTVDPNQLASAYSQDPTGVQNLLSAVGNAVLNAVEFYLQPNGQISNQIESLQSDQNNLIGQVQADQQNGSAANQQKNTQSQQAIAAYNLLSLANGGTVSTLG